ncbi:hypothetical protein [Ascidiimonas sp. W6]|uniref:hypothetical protein n=1 Tax=Ascidiimonas meishanensis TaxID=3128903 RepID=UPI0030ED9992
MKKILILLIGLLFFQCGPARMTNTWLNDEYINYSPKKVLVVGVTNNLIARKLFEEQLSRELQVRGIKAAESYHVLPADFSTGKQTEKAIQKQLDKFTSQDFDAVLVSAVKGIENRRYYTQPYTTSGIYFRRFRRYYFQYQNIYYTPGYYDRYKVYHLETALFDITKDNERSLIWVGSYDLVDPKNISNTVSDYTRRIINSMEKERIIPIKN